MEYSETFNHLKLQITTRLYYYMNAYYMYRISTHYTICVYSVPTSTQYYPIYLRVHTLYLLPISTMTADRCKPWV